MPITDEEVKRVARAVSGLITKVARESGEDPIAWVTGNNFMPPLRWFASAEVIWQEAVNQENPRLWKILTEEVERILGEEDVYLGCPEYDNALYAVDERRFEAKEDQDGETLQGDWTKKP
jgi:hypothetical protein